ncbi:hypothetical protein AJ79_07730 [Helicocarpus griseus UAMH5409]|uniref:L-rhamnose-1-dehydrogenase n=1 Tax=Helicocarpus griseus UAMH5409 TaxID=1447875 RepID=A0A2B7WZW0_9EURO|nr:hypothetical protein AJ79_07730 [Helicocarpus griseus UAMH5409]
MVLIARTGIEVDLSAPISLQSLRSQSLLLGLPDPVANGADVVRVSLATAVEFIVNLEFREKHANSKGKTDDDSPMDETLYSVLLNDVHYSLAYCPESWADALIEEAEKRGYDNLHSTWISIRRVQSRSVEDFAEPKPESFGHHWKENGWKAIALEYLRQGASVAINYLGRPAEAPLLEELFREADKIIKADSGSMADQNEISEAKRFIAVAGDISQPETGGHFVAETVKAFGRLDVFVSNAGVCQFREFLEIDPTLLNHTISTNLSGSFYATQAAARQMAQSQSPPGGSIIGISSISALVGGGQQAHYTPTKAGINSLMQSCAVALGKYGIRCNALLPGTIRTQLNEEDMKDDAKRTYMEGRIPLGRLGKTADLAGPAVFLGCETLSGYVTGAQILVDGGLFVNLQ